MIFYQEFRLDIGPRLAIALAATCVALVASCGGNPPTPDLSGLENEVEPFDIENYYELRPEPVIRPIDLRIDDGFGEHEKLPKDAISPIYTPKYVSVDEAVLIDEELVMGIDINGEARAMPVALMRFREMLNDEIGGVPILATW